MQVHLLDETSADFTVIRIGVAALVRRPPLAPPNVKEPTAPPDESAGTKRSAGGTPRRLVKVPAGDVIVQPSFHSPLADAVGARTTLACSLRAWFRASSRSLTRSNDALRSRWFAIRVAKDGAATAANTATTATTTISSIMVNPRSRRMWFLPSPATRSGSGFYVGVGNRHRAALVGSLSPSRGCRHGEGWNGVRRCRRCHRKCVEGRKLGLDRHSDVACCEVCCSGGRNVLSRVKE